MRFDEKRCHSRGIDGIHHRDRIIKPHGPRKDGLVSGIATDHSNRRAVDDRIEFGCRGRVEFTADRDIAVRLKVVSNCLGPGLRAIEDHDLGPDL